MEVFQCSDSCIFKLLLERWKRVLRKIKGTFKIYQLKHGIDVRGDEITVLLAGGQHHGVETHQRKGHLAEQLAGGLAFFQPLAPCQ